MCLRAEVPAHIMPIISRFITIKTWTRITGLHGSCFSKFLSPKRNWIMFILFFYMKSNDAFNCEKKLIQLYLSLYHMKSKNESIDGVLFFKSHSDMFEDFSQRIVNSCSFCVTLIKATLIRLVKKRSGAWLGTGANTDFPWQNVNPALMSAKQTRPLPLRHVSLSLWWTWRAAAVRGYPSPFTVLIWKTNVSPLEIRADSSFALIRRSRSS